MDPHVRSVNSPFKVAQPCVEGSDNGICHPDFDISLKVSKTKLLPGFTKYTRHSREYYNVLGPWQHKALL